MEVMEKRFGTNANGRVSLMKTSDAINKKIQELSEPLQREVLDFV
jgi:hypothetical protein